MNKISILFVCTGNICRSPTAEAVLQKIVSHTPLDFVIEVDSAGTQNYHVGDAPDRRAQLHAAKRGYEMSHLRARALHHDDYHHFDLLLAMDHSHLSYMRRACPIEHQQKLHMFLEFSHSARTMEVGDPYYGGEQGFELVLDLIEDGCKGLLEYVQDQMIASV